MTSNNAEQLLQQAAVDFSAGRFESAAANCERVLALQPNDVNALHLAAQLAMRGGRPDQAVKVMSRAVALAPTAPLLLHNFAAMLRMAGQLPLAAETYRRAIERAPNNAASHHGLGITLDRLHRPAEAVVALRNAVRLKPDFIEAWIALGRSLANTTDFAAAEQAARHAVSLKPNDPATNFHLGHVLMSAHKTDAAIAQFRRTIAVAPDVVAAYQNLASLLGEEGRMDETIALQRKTVVLAPSDASLHSNLLLSLHYSDAFTAQQIFDEHLVWAKRHAPEAQRKLIHANDRTPDRKLRIGYLSPDYNRHPVASFLESVLAGHDAQQFEVVAYSNTQRRDVTTARLASLAYRWRDIRPMNDEQAAAQIEDDEIDILIDLAGHTAHNRAPLMARGAAPVQVTYLGYPDTTGIPAVQYRLTDAHADPRGANDALHTEELIRLPERFLCYRPDDDVPDPGPPPSVRNGYITFGSFNNFAKVTEATMSCWATILLRTPNSKLLLKARALSGESAKQRVIDLFAKCGVSADRLIVVGWTEYGQRHAITQSVDLALDSFPYHGTTTTCETLWAGIPWITRAGATHVSRVGVSILSNLGLQEWIARDEADYIERAIALANNAERLADARATLRERFRASPLFDRAGFARKLEAEYRKLWRRWCGVP